MAYDAVNMADWQISEEAEKNMPTPDDWVEKLGLKKDEMLPMGRLGKLDFLKIIDRLKDKPDGKYIEVTAITPTPLGEGKSTTSCGLMEGLGKRGKNVGGALRQPSGGPTMNVKGTAAGGGNSLLIPMTEFSLGLTGDINDIMNAHNLAMVAMTSRMQHERNYNDEQLARLTGMPRLDIDPTRVEMGWIIDYCAQALRNIVIGIGGSYLGARAVLDALGGAAPGVRRPAPRSGAPHAASSPLTPALPPALALLPDVGAYVVECLPRRP